MWTPSEKDFDTIKKWGHFDNPFAAVDDFSHTKSERRWLNPEQNEIYDEYVRKRFEYIQSEDFDTYYRDAEKPIDFTRWQYLMFRKAWFIMPLGWEQIALTGGRVVDLGCGDGDTVQRLIDFVQKQWEEKGVTNKKLEITGIDLNYSRVDNARNHVRSENQNITFNFEQGDAVGSKINAKSGAFDYSLCCGVLEILNDDQCASFMDELTRITAKGIYIEDLFERFPGGYPRDTLGKLLFECGFLVKERHVVLSEPFNTEKIQDPMKLWPNLLDQNIYAEKI